MEHQRKTQMNQTPPPPPPEHYFGNGFPFQPLSPAGLNNTQQTPPVYLPSSLDVDQTLANALSRLSVSQDNHSDCLTFLPQNLDYEYGGVSSPIGGQGFNSPFHSCNSFDESWRVSNAVNDHQRFCYGVGHDNPLPVDPLYRRHYQYPPSPSYNRESLPGTYPSWFDQRFDSYLLSKERFYSRQHLNSYHNCCSSIPSAAHRNESFPPRNNFLIPSDDIDNLNLRHTHNRNRVELQNQQFLSLLPLKDMRGMISTMAKDQNGCRILQSKFENPTKEEIEFVLSEVMGSISDLMKDQFGNYLIQKLVSLCDADQKALILRELTERPYAIILVSMSPYGTRAIQTLLENLKDPNQIKMVIRALHRGAAKLSNDQNGHHVIQYILKHFDSDYNQLIFEDIANNCFKVATDRSGCCVLQTCIDYSRGQVKTRLFSEIILNALHMAEDPYGNYVLQHIVGMKKPELTKVLLEQLKGHFSSLSRNKYASNVVEKCLTTSGMEIAEKIIFELVKSPNPSALLLDPYGNFVIQSALDVAMKNDEGGLAHESLRKLILRNVASMQNNLYGKKVLERIEKKKIVRV